MNPFTIKFDDSLFTDQHERLSHPKKLGFYKQGNCYIFSNSILTKLPLTTDLSKISKVLNNHTLSADTLEGYDLKKTDRAIRFLEEIHDVIGKRNKKLKQRKEKTLIKILLLIPLINRIVQWALRDVVSTLSSAKQLLLNAIKRTYHLSDIPLSKAIDDTIQRNNSFSLIYEQLKELKKLSKITKLTILNDEELRKKFQRISSPANPLDHLLKIIKEVRADTGNFVLDQKSWEEAALWNNAEEGVRKAFYIKPVIQQAVIPVTDLPPEVAQQKVEDIQPQSELLIREEVGQQKRADNASPLKSSKKIVEQPNQVEIVEKSTTEDSKLKIISAIVNSKRSFREIVSELINYFKTEENAHNKIEENQKIFTQFFMKRVETQKFREDLKAEFAETTFLELEEKYRAFLQLASTWKVQYQGVLPEFDLCLSSMEKMTHEVYNEHLLKLFPALPKAEKILLLTSVTKDFYYDTILEISLQTSFEEAEEAYKALQLTLVKKDEAIQYPEKIQSTIEQAQKEVKKAYGQWLILKADSLDQKILLNDYLNQDTYEKILQSKQSLLKWVEKAEQFHMAIETPATIVNPLQQIKKRVEVAFDVRIRQIYPSLVRAESLIDASKSCPEELWKGIDLQADDSFDKVLDAYKADFILPEHFPKTYLPKIEDAKTLLTRAFGQWLVQLINRLPASKLPSEMLESKEGTRLERYQFLITQIKMLKDDSAPTQSAMTTLTFYYESVLKKLMGPLADFNSGTEINRKYLFKEKSTHQQLTECIAGYNKICEEWDAFQKVKFKQKTSVEQKPLAPVVRLFIDKKLVEENCERYPIYRRSLEIIKGTELKLKKAVIEQELKPYKELEGKKGLIPEELMKEVKQAELILWKKYGVLETKNYYKGKNEAEGRQASLLSLVKGIFTSEETNVRNYLLEEMGLFKISLGLKQQDSFELVNQRYLHLMTVFEKAGVALVSELSAGYKKYALSNQLLPIINLFGKENENLSLDSIVQGTFSDKHAFINVLLGSRAAFIACYQGGVPLSEEILKAFNKYYTHILDKWINYRADKYPVYSLINSITLKQSSDKWRENAYTWLLSKDTSRWSYKEVFKFYDENISNLKKQKIDALPQSVKEDIEQCINLLLIAYTEWEIQHLYDSINLQHKLVESKRKDKPTPDDIKDKTRILGLPENASDSEIIERLNALRQLLDPNKNKHLSQSYQFKLIEANKLLAEALWK